MFRDPGCAQAGGAVLVIASLFVVVGLVGHPPPAGGFAEDPRVLEATPWWGLIHVVIAIGFVLMTLAGLLVLIAGGAITRSPWSALSWGAITVGMIFFTGVALINGWVMHGLVELGAPERDPLVFEAFNRLLVGYGWLGNPLFLAGVTGVAMVELRDRVLGLSPQLAWFGVLAAIASWGRGIGSAFGIAWLEPLIYANVLSFLWLALLGYRIARRAQQDRLLPGPIRARD